MHSTGAYAYAPSSSSSPCFIFNSMEYSNPIISEHSHTLPHQHTFNSSTNGSHALHQNQPTQQQQQPSQHDAFSPLPNGAAFSASSPSPAENTAQPPPQQTNVFINHISSSDPPPPPTANNMIPEPPLPTTEPSPHPSHHSNDQQQQQEQRPTGGSAEPQVCHALLQRPQHPVVSTK